MPQCGRRKLRSQFTWAAPLVLLLGSVAVLAYNCRLWQRDRARAASLARSSAWTILRQYPNVSILVAAWNEVEILADHIAAFNGLAYPNRELVLCAGGPDGTFALAEALANDDVSGVVVLEQRPGEGKQSALQRCFEASTGDILFLTDADCLLDDVSFTATLAPLINEGEAAATGGSRPLDAQLGDPFVLQQWYADVYVRSHWGDYTNGVLGRNAALTRPALAAVGAFSAPVRTGTDFHMAKELLRRGERIRVARSAVRTHYADTVGEYRRQQARWLRNVVMHGMTYRAYPEVLASFAPSMLGLAMLALPMLALVLGPVAPAIWAVLLLQAVLSRMRYVRFGQAITGQSFPAYERILVYVVIDWAVWASVLPEYLLRRMRHRW